MTLKAGMTVRTTKACSGLSADGAVDLPEGVKGTVLTLEGDLALVNVRETAASVYVRATLLAGCKGRPLKAESLARAIAERRPGAVDTSDAA